MMMPSFIREKPDILPEPAPTPPLLWNFRLIYYNSIIFFKFFWITTDHIKLIWNPDPHSWMLSPLYHHHHTKLKDSIVIDAVFNVEKTHLYIPLPAPIDTLPPLLPSIYPPNPTLYFNDHHSHSLVYYFTT